ncbi:MAG: anti-sigma factor antagonist [Sporomusaceae bacterium]|nr:anti-sigma factor antagonist [Sporomusaceae bacterium]
MNVAVEMCSGKIVVRLEGELDLLTVKDFRDAVDSFLNSRKGSQLILNLSGLTFIDSSGIGALLGRYKKAQLLGGCVAVTNVQPQVRRILECSGLVQLFLNYETEEAALQEL